MSKHLKKDIVPKNDLASKAFTFFHCSILNLLPKIKREHVWLVVVRYLFNKHEICREENCDEKDDVVHFHDSQDWFGEDSKILDEFFATLATRDKTNMYVDDIMSFIATEQKQIARLFEDQKAASLELFRNIADDEAREYLHSLLEDKTNIRNSFCFYSSLICTLMEMQAQDCLQDGTAVETQWFQVFFRYFLEDYDDEDDEDDGEEADAKEEGELSEASGSDDESEDSDEPDDQSEEGGHRKA